MKILITGGSGFIGSTLALSLANNGHEVAILDRRPNPALSAIRFWQGEFSDSSLLDTALEEVEVVYHLAWSTIPATSNADPEADASANVIGTLRLLNACVKKGVRRIVFSSTGGAVYGNTEISPVAEDAPTNPLCSYGITKLAVEKYLGLFAHLKKMDYVALRISNAYGPHQDPKSKVGFIGAALAAAANKQVLYVWGDGTIVRDYVFVDDIIQSMVMASGPTFPNGVYHVSSGIGLDLNGLISIVSSAVGFPLEVNYSSGRDFDVKRVVLDNSKLRALGWSPGINVNEGIRRTWDWMKDNAHRSGQAY